MISADVWSLSDLCTPWCVHVVATLRIAEHIEGGTTGIAKLAAAVGAKPDVLVRVMRHLVSKGLFQEPNPGEFTLNDAARGLLDSPVRLALDLDSFGGRMAHAWGGLLTAVRTGTPAYHEIFGRPFWDDLATHPDLRASFDALMGPAGHGAPDPNVLISGDWDTVHTVVDVGGGTGSLLAEVLRAHTEVRGILVDVAPAVDRSGAIFQAAGVAERVTAISQSFFDPLPAGADLYMLKNVLSDWPDGEAVALLRRCAEAARPTGRVIILGGVTPGDVPSPELLMMVLVGGKARTLAEFCVLARAAGLEVTAAARQDSGRFVVECRPLAQASRAMQ